MIADALLPDVVLLLGVLIVITLLTLLASYNALMQLRHEVRAAWSRMDDELKKRYLLVPRLTAAVQSAQGEAGLHLGSVTTAKNQAAVAFTPIQLSQAETALSAAIREAIKAGDQQDNLKSDPNYHEIRRQLIENEALISDSIRKYNDRVDTLNASITSFPYVFTARAIGLRLQPIFGM